MGGRPGSEIGYPEAEMGTPWLQVGELGASFNNRGYPRSGLPGVDNAKKA